MIGHFGYTYTCADGSTPELEMYVDIGEQNRFSPGNKDRGQSKVFYAGMNVDVFEVEFTPEEVEKDAALVWTVRDRGAHVSFTRTADAFLDCSELSP